MSVEQNPGPQLSERNPTSSRRAVLALAALFIVPMLFALWYVNYAGAPGATKNYGELVQPARPLSAFALQTLDGEPFGADELQGKWSLVYFGGGECGTACAENLYKMRQSRLSQGQEIKRVRRLYILLDAAPGDSLSEVLREHEGLEVLTGRPAELDSLVAQFDLPGAAPRAAERVYIVDPLGNLMMSYPAGFDAKGLAKDLRLLLRASQIG
ncbi:MAG: SCO family protein [Pseudomonadota bacterium]|nr:MAG: SCO family protein [Pseudomonadota bacterium]